MKNKIAGIRAFPGVRNSIAAVLSALFLPAAWGCVGAPPPDVAPETREEVIVYDSPDLIEPPAAGSPLPGIVLSTPGGETFDLNRFVAESPTILVYYRGGWCPYCNSQLAELGRIEPRLVEMGYRILAVSADRPERVREAAEENGYAYRLLSDNTMAGARALGIAFRVDDETLERYRGYGIDLEESSGNDHHILPVPAVFIIDTDGIIRFVHANPDYRVRISTEELLSVAADAAG